jgi:Do/DeqQ family serine protease
MLRRFWLLFAQVATVCVAALFVVATLRPDLLARFAGKNNVVLVQETPLTVPAPKIASLADAAKKAMPSVVNIYTSKEVRHRPPLADDPILRRFFPGLEESEPRRATSLGSGVIVSSEGYVLTNNHVVEEADDIELVLADGRRMRAAVRGSDPESDLAVLKVDGKNLPVITFGQLENVQVGDTVLAIGSPFGFGSSVTHGIVSALGRSHLGINRFEDFIQTDAAVNPGNSGGALVDSSGNLVGINSAIFSQSGGSQGIGFAIPSNMVRVVVASAKSGGKAVKRPWLGARLQAVTPEIAETLGLKLPNGALVSSVVSGSPAAKAGLKVSDLIVGIDGQEIDDPNAFDYRFATRPIGGSAQIDVQRAGKALKLTIALEAAPDSDRGAIVLTSRSPFQGANVANISPALADELHLDSDIEGVVVIDLAEDGTAAHLGFQKGDIILAVNNQKIGKTSDLEKAAQASSRVWRITLVRGGQQINVTLGG